MNPHSSNNTSQSTVATAEQYPTNNEIKELKNESALAATTSELTGKVSKLVKSSSDDYESSSSATSNTSLENDSRTAEEVSTAADGTGTGLNKIEEVSTAIDGTDTGLNLTDTGLNLIEEVVVGRERIKRHRVDVAGRVWIPEIWGQEDLLKDWTDCSGFEASLMNNTVMSARAALIEEGRRANSSSLRMEAGSC